MCAICIYNVHLFQFYLFHFRMPPARRNPRYNVHNVIAIIQKGEGDVDIDFDDTDASDEESDIDVSVDKENQEPTDCPANVNIEPGQSKKYIMPHDRHH